MSNIATKFKKMSTIDKCFFALFVATIILVSSFLVGLACLYFGIGIFGNPIFTCHTLLTGGLIIELSILICSAIVMLFYK